jgi:hypothetical protein
MSVPLTEQKILQIRSGNRCAFRGCGELLVRPSTFGTRPVVTGEIGHIVSESPDGPRGEHFLPPGDHDKYPNLMFLCSLHHTEVDTRPAAYPVELLKEMKHEHEVMVEKAITQAKQNEKMEILGRPLVTEVVYSTLLPVSRMPIWVFSAPCTYTDSQEREAAKGVLLKETSYLCPFIIRSGMLFAFNDLRRGDGPFGNIVDRGNATKSLSTGWWDDPDKSRWFTALLNRTLNKMTGRKGLQLDKDHHRYFFSPDEPGREKTIEYRPLNQSTTERKVVWQPVRKKTNQPRPFWKHLAVSVRFEHLGRKQWCLCIRPEMRITKDGFEPLESKKIGSRVTKHKAHMFNYDLLEDVNFWRDYLSAGQPRIILKFENNAGIVISTTLMATSVQWPGIPEEFAKPFANVDYEENPFSALELQEFPDEGSELDALNAAECEDEEQIE